MYACCIIREDTKAHLLSGNRFLAAAKSDSARCERTKARSTNRFGSDSDANWLFRRFVVSSFHHFIIVFEKVISGCTDSKEALNEVLQQRGLTADESDWAGSVVCF